MPQNDVMTSPLSPSSPLNFSGTFPILSNNPKNSKKMGRYRPASVFIRDLSSESESDSGNDKILQNLMLERLKARDELTKLQSKVLLQANPQSSIDSNSSSITFREGDFLSRKEAFLNSMGNSAKISENDNDAVCDFGKIPENRRLGKKHSKRDPVSALSTPRKSGYKFNKSFISNPTSARSDPTEIDPRGTRIPSFIYSRSNKSSEENSPYFSKSAISSARSEIKYEKKISSFRDNKLRVPRLALRSQDLSPSISSRGKGKSLDMKALVTALSDVSVRRENAVGDSGKSRSEYSGNTGNRDFQTSARSTDSKTQLSSNFRSPASIKTPTRIPGRITLRSDQSDQNSEIDSQRSVSSTGKKSAMSSPKEIEKTRNDFLFKKRLPEIPRFVKPLSTSGNLSKLEILTNILSSRTEYSELKSTRDKRSTRSFEFASSDLGTTKKDSFCNLKEEESSSESIRRSQNDYGVLGSKVVDQAEIFSIDKFSSENHLPIKEYDLSTTYRKSKDGGNKENVLSDAFPRKISSAESHHQEKNDLQRRISSVVEAPFKLDPITVLETSETFLFRSPFKDSESLMPSKSVSHKISHGNADQSFPDLAEEIETQNKPVEKPLDEETQSPKFQQTNYPNQSDKEEILDDFLINNEMFESGMGDSNQEVPRKWCYRSEIKEKYPPEIPEPHYQGTEIINLGTTNFNPESGKDIRGRNSLNLIESSASFNSMKLAKSDSTAILSKMSTDHPNLPAKSSSSMSKLTCLIDSMKKENQDRFPYTISESTSRNSSKFKVEGEEDHTKENIPQFEESGEISYKLDIHPSITRLALSGAEPLPSEIISSVSYKSINDPRNFLPRMRNYVRRLSTSLRKKKKTKNSKSDHAQILFKNLECRLESAGSSGDTMELQFLDEEVEETKESSNSKNFEGNLKSVPNFLEIPDKRDRRDFRVQRFDSETENSQIADAKSSRAKSSPVDIKTRRSGYSGLGEPKSKDVQDLLFEEKREKTTPEVKLIPEEDVPAVDDIKVEIQERQSEIGVQTSCFCFKMCRDLVQPSIGSPGSAYLASKMSKPNPSNRKKP